MDVLVVGSGAGALTAAIAAADAGGEVLVVEKDRLWGGTSASSGGGLWIPCSPLGIEQGLEDSPEEAFGYVKALVGDDVANERLMSYIENAPRMLSYMLDKTELNYRAQPYADYHTDVPGAKLGWRMHEPVEVDGARLGEDYFTLQPTHPIAMLFGRIAWVISESYPIMTRAPGWRKTIAKMFVRYYFDFPHRFKTKRDRKLTMGNAMMGRLRLSLNDRKVPLWLETPMKELIVENGAVRGAVVFKDGRNMEIEARKGVVLGAGGFERNEDLRKAYLPAAAPSGFTASIGKNTGDALKAGEKIGAKLDILDTAWWAPGYKFAGDDRAYPMFIERALPGSMIVNQNGKRYMNEAASYHVTGKIMAEADPAANPAIPSFFIFDANYRKKYAVGPIIPSGFMPDWRLPKKVRDLLVKADKIIFLADKLGIDRGALQAQTERFNKFAETGVDEDFGRGSFAYDLYYGDHNQKPNPCLGKLETGPFYAIPIYPVDIGTKGGLLTDERARVIGEDDRPIQGLYAVGNSAASVVGRTYPGAGVVLGPSMTFGFLAGRHAMGVNE